MKTLITLKGRLREFLISPRTKPLKFNYDGKEYKIEFIKIRYYGELKNDSYYEVVAESDCPYKEVIKGFLSSFFVKIENITTLN